MLAIQVIFWMFLEEISKNFNLASKQMNDCLLSNLVVHSYPCI